MEPGFDKITTMYSIDTIGILLPIRIPGWYQVYPSTRKTISIN